VIAAQTLERIRIDDVVGAIPAHLVCGIWGTLAVPLTNPNASFLAQAEGVVAVGAFVAVGSTVVWYAIKHTMGLRPSLDDELAGLDHAELGLEIHTDWGSDPFRKGDRRTE
jgi:Amt family ammonium transporter